MTTSHSLAAYDDCFALFDRALEAPSGIRTSLPERGAAFHLCTRLQYARVLSRQEASQVYAIDDPKHGISPYDILIVRTPRFIEGKWWVYIEPRAILGEVEELGAAE